MRYTQRAILFPNTNNNQDSNSQIKTSNLPKDEIIITKVIFSPYSLLCLCSFFIVVLVRGSYETIKLFSPMLYIGFFFNPIYTFPLEISLNEMKYSNRKFQERKQKGVKYQSECYIASYIFTQQ